MVKGVKMSQIVYQKVIGWLNKNIVLEAIRNGMLLAIPIIMIGSLCIIIRNLPFFLLGLDQKAIMASFPMQVFDVVIDSTFDILSMFLLLTISYSYAKLKQFDNIIMVPIVTMAAYIAFSVSRGESATIEIYQAAWQLNAIVFSVSCSALFIWLCEKSKARIKQVSGSANPLFNATMVSIFPACITVIIFLGIKGIIVIIFGVSNFQEIISTYFYDLFLGLGTTPVSSFLFVLLKQIMWFLGIHGSHVLDNAFVKAGNLQGIVNSGSSINPIFTESFFGNFVFMGGCGTILCLVIAFFLFAKKKQTKQVAKFASLPVIFNVNELMIFGLPIVFNPIFLIPFILVPCCIMLVTFFAMHFELVPIARTYVGWTTPVLLSGYLTTGSISGVFLQIVNIILGVSIYAPFVKKYEKSIIDDKHNKIKELEEYIKECEDKGSKPILSDRYMANILMKELKQDIRDEKVQMYYQPQVNYDGIVIGAEALLRWYVEDVGFMYPPLVIALANEGDITEELNEYIIHRVCKNVQDLKDFPDSLEFSFNISAEQMSTPYIVDHIKSIIGEYQYGKHVLGLEITEQTALQCSKEVIKKLTEIREMGIKIIMDDFGMGHSSLIYLKDNEFDLVKMDGSLVKNITENPRCGEIISSIIQLSKSLGFDVLAEYVETTEQKESLNLLNCKNYQGYLYSKPIPFDELLSFIQKINT